MTRHFTQIFAALMLTLLLVASAPAQQHAGALSRSVRPRRPDLARLLVTAPPCAAESVPVGALPSRHRLGWLIAGELVWCVGSAFDIHATRRGIAEGSLAEGNPLLATRERGLNAALAWVLTGAVAGGAALLWRKYPRWAVGILAVGGVVRGAMSGRAGRIRADMDLRTRARPGRAGQFTRAADTDRANWVGPAGKIVNR